TSYEIDQRVKAIVQESLSVYRVDGEKLRNLEPDVIVTQAQCEVCAVSLREVERTVCAWLRQCPKLVSLMPNALADVWADIEHVAGAHEHTAQLHSLTNLLCRLLLQNKRPGRPSASHETATLP